MVKQSQAYQLAMPFMCPTVLALRRRLSVSNRYRATWATRRHACRLRNWRAIARVHAADDDSEHTVRSNCRVHPSQVCYGIAGDGPVDPRENRKSDTATRLAQGLAREATDILPWRVLICACCRPPTRSLRRLHDFARASLLSYCGLPLDQLPSWRSAPARKSAQIISKQ